LGKSIWESAGESEDVETCESDGIEDAAAGGGVGVF
jgi:hypothetical protein